MIDVRERSEWQDGHVYSSVNVPFYKVRNSKYDKLDRHGCCGDVICAGGVRSMIAASVLQAEGFTSVLNIEGGMDAWTSSHLPIVQEKADCRSGSLLAQRSALRWYSVHCSTGRRSHRSARPMRISGYRPAP